MTAAITKIIEVSTKTVEVNQNGSLETEGRLVIFPKYTFYLVDRNIKVDVIGDKIGDRKLVSLMVDRLLMGYEDNRDADILLFDLEKKVWLAIYVTNPNADITIKRKGYDSYTYSAKLCDSDNYGNETLHINAISNFIRINSSANLVVR